jgi:uncharacterized protein (TIGR03086 family)
MTDIAQLHRRALDATGHTVAGIRAEHWSAATPDAEWDVRALLNHLVAGNFWAAELAAGKTIGEVGERLDGDVLGDDPTGAYEASAKVAADVFETPGALEAPCAVSYGPVPGSVYAGHRFLDVLIHGWDLAVASGQDATLDPELVRGCLEVVEPQLSLLQASGAFGPSIQTAPDADPQARLLAMLGRRNAG